jgi:hypothetical protein
MLMSKQIAETVNAAMAVLPEELRQAITLREIEGLSYEEIAEMMNCPIGTVRSRIFRAREAIAAKLRPLLDTPEGRAGKRDGCNDAGRGLVTDRVVKSRRGVCKMGSIMGSVNTQSQACSRGERFPLWSTGNCSTVRITGSFWLS